jgi:hypothetical protein
VYLLTCVLNLGVCSAGDGMQVPGGYSVILVEKVASGGTDFSSGDW